MLGPIRARFARRARGTGCSRADRHDLLRRHVHVSTSWRRRSRPRCGVHGRDLVLGEVPSSEIVALAWAMIARLLVGGQVLDLRGRPPSTPCIRRLDEAVPLRRRTSTRPTVRCSAFGVSIGHIRRSGWSARLDLETGTLARQPPGPAPRGGACESARQWFVWSMNC